MGDSTAMKELRVAFITQSDPFYVREFFDEFFRAYDWHGDVKAVVIAPAMGKKTFAALLRQMYQFYGPWIFFWTGIRYVLYRLASNLPDWVCGGRTFSIEQVCRHHGIRVLHANNVNAPDFLAQLARLELDLIVSVAAPQIFANALISLPRLGCINIHNSKLPKYRGMLPNFWQMFHGERSAGTSIHRINAGIDDGDILLQAETPINPRETLDALIRRTKVHGARMMVDMLRQFKNGEVRVLPNCREEATYFTFPTRADVAEFRRRGYRLA